MKPSIPNMATLKAKGGPYVIFNPYTASLRIEKSSDGDMIIVELPSSNSFFVEDPLEDVLAEFARAMKEKLS